MIYFIGAGPGVPDLITLRGARLLRQADLVIYAGSLVNPELLKECPPRCTCLDSSGMTLEEVISAIQSCPGETIVRLHTGDPSLYGAIQEQMDALTPLAMALLLALSMSAAAAAMQTEYTLPGVSQTVIVSRMAGRTPVPDREQIRSLASHQSTMVLFLSVSMLPDLCRELMEGGYRPDTPAAVVYRASWPDQAIIRGTLSDLPQKASGVRKTALVLVGDFLSGTRERSKLYDPSFTHGYREGKK